MKNNRSISFLSRLLLLSIPFYLLTIRGYNIYFLERIVRDCINVLLKTLGFTTRIFDTLSINTLNKIPAIHVKDLVIGFDNACTGIRSSYLFFALLFSANNSNKLYYLFTGLLIIFLANIVRIISVIILYIPDTNILLFDSLLWSGFLNIIVFLLFYFSLKA